VPGAGIEPHASFETQDFGHGGSESHRPPSAASGGRYLAYAASTTIT